MRTKRRASGRAFLAVSGGIIAAVSLFLTASGIAARTGDEGASDVELSARIDRHTVPLDETAELHVLVEWNGPADRYRFGWPEAPQAFHLSIVGSKRGSRSWVDSSGEHSRQEFTYVLQPQEAGKASLGAVRLTYWDTADTSQAGRTLFSAPISLEIVPPRGRGSGIRWVGVAVVFLVLAALAFAVRKLRPSRSPRAPGAGDAPAPPDELAEHLDALGRAREERDVPHFYAEAEAALRVALERGLREPVAHLGVGELISRIENGEWPEQVVTALAQFMRKVERRRFAPSEPEEWELKEDEATVRKLCDSMDVEPGSSLPVAEERDGNRQGS